MSIRSRRGKWRSSSSRIAEFPRSIRFSVDSLDSALHRIPGSSEAQYANEVERLSGRLRSDLDYVTIADIFEFGLHEYLETFRNDSSS